MKRCALLLTLGLLSAASTFANIAGPNNPKQTPSKRFINTTLSIRLDRDAKEARLLIPKSQLKELRAALDDIDVGADIASTTTRSSLGVQTMVGGAFLSLAMVFGGLWFARSRKGTNENGRVVVALAVALALGAGSALVWANAGPPAEARSITGKMFSQAVHMYGFGSGRIKLETSDENDRIELIVPDPAASPTPSE